MNNERIIQSLEKLIKTNADNLDNTANRIREIIYSDLLEIFKPEEKEPEEKYFKLINSYGWDKRLVKDQIYPGSFKLDDWKNTILYHATHSANSWLKVSKEEYDRQELLKEAKERYPIGSLVKELTILNTILRIKSHKDPYNTANEVWFEGKENIQDGGNVCILVYKNHRWAEIIKEEREPLFVFEDKKYFKEDKYFCFNKESYKIEDYIVCLGLEKHECLENETQSKIFSTEQQCKESLYKWILENHFISESKRTEMFYLFANNGVINDWKTFYCETIIKQTNG